MTESRQQLNEKIEAQSSFTEPLLQQIRKIIIGQDDMVQRLLVALLTNGHLLMEGMPGLAKTLAIKTMAQAIDAKFNRIQFTPDLLPADLIGTTVYNYQTNEFTIRRGPVFANFILADEINRASAKVQSALLQAMEEHLVTISDKTFTLSDPFLVMATQNPIEHEGTYQLPEAQTDRFMMKVVITYPTMEEEQLIMIQETEKKREQVSVVAHPEQIIEAREAAREIYVDPKIQQYILNLVFATRTPEKYQLEKLKSMFRFGSSPRGSIYLMSAAKAFAFINHRAFVLPDDVQDIFFDVMRHRIGISYEAEAENVTPDEILSEILNTVKMP